MLTAAEIRQKYIDFFVGHDHTHVASSPLVPPDDPTLLFASAGMVQFKQLYSGAVPLPYTRATTCQKCLRAGGKGSDLENVGVTLRHFTFFEMLGNFSFGDYFKEDSIVWAWDFCTNPNWLGLPPERIWATVFGKRDKSGEWIVDDEAEAIWRDKTGVVNPIIRLDEKENFWGPAGESGACGPCSEIKFFMGTDEQLRNYQELARSGDDAKVDKVAYDLVELGDLFLEIWNLVFPQFDHQLDGSRPPLKNRGIDTGLGLERTTTAVQFIQSDGKILTPYETDLLKPMIKAMCDISGLPYPNLAGDPKAEEQLKAKGLDPAMVRLAMNACVDHARALTFTLAEGIVPSNEGRGYVLRRILRRAARFGKKIGISKPFLSKLVQPIVELMAKPYPELFQTDMSYVIRTIMGEEERFNRTLNQGSEILDQMLEAKNAGERLSGEDAYRLYDTYGFPLDLSVEAADERGIAIDLEGFERCLAEGKARARASWKGGAGTGQWVALTRDLGEKQKTEFTGYEATRVEAKVIALIHEDKRVEEIEEGQPGMVILDRSPFYAEGGGQIGDSGLLTDDQGIELFRIEVTQQTEDGCWLHFGEAVEPLRVGDAVVARVDDERRRRTMHNHSVTHLMQGALKRIIGDHVTQQGSFVGPDNLRFDFTNPEPVGEEKLRQVEAIVNEQIRHNLAVDIKVMSLEEARATGAIAPFGEKYGAQVRVVTMGDFSREFCGGTHVSATGEIGLFVVTGESSVAAGIRRIEAKAGAAAFEHVARERQMVHDIARKLSTPPEGIEERVGGLLDEIKQLRRKMKDIESSRTSKRMREAVGKGEEVAGIHLIRQEIEGANMGVLAKAWDAAREQSGEKTVGVFYGVADGKVNLVVGVTEDIAPSRLKAADVLKPLAAIIGGKGGGKPTLARGGGTQPEKLAEAIESVPKIIGDLLAN